MSDKPISVSASTLSILAECPRCFWLHFHGVARPRGAFPSLPGGLDLVIKDYCDAYRATGKLPPLLDGKVPGKLADLPFRHMTFDHPATGLRVTGKLDECLELPGPRFTPLDHKTRGSPPGGLHSSYRLQASLYGALLKWNGYVTGEVAYFAFYFPVRGTALHEGFPFEVKVLTCAMDTEYVENLLRNAKESLAMPAAPPPLAKCEYCEYARHASRERFDTHPTSG